METNRGCPYTATHRAARCAPCCESNEGLPPCVASYVGWPCATPAPLSVPPISLQWWRERRDAVRKAA